jgi:hypothetical protein
MIKTIIIVISIIILVLLVNEVYEGFLRQTDRQNIFKLAQARALEQKKPLLVYGDPYYGIGSRFFNTFMDGYGCGDETVDLTGCPGCSNGKKSDILAHLKTKESNSQVIFVSCVLEYVDEIDQVIKEIIRVAGSLDNVFVVTVGKKSLSAYFYSEDDYKAKNLITAPPKFNELTYKKI